MKFKQGDNVALILEKGQHPSFGCGGYNRNRDYNAEGVIIDSAGPKAYHVKFPFQGHWTAGEQELKLIYDLPKEMFEL